MKKLLLMAAVACCLAACNKELGPEYKTPPVVGAVTYTPVDVQPDQKVKVQTTLTSTYGLYSAFIIYWLNDQTEPSYQAGVIFYPEKEASAVYTGEIPGQKAGTKVSFGIIANSPYAMGASEEYSYTVAGEPEQPEPGDPDVI